MSLKFRNKYTAVTPGVSHYFNKCLGNLDDRLFYHADLSAVEQQNDIGKGIILECPRVKFPLL